MAAVTHSAAVCIGAVGMTLLMRHQSSPPQTADNNSADGIISQDETKQRATSKSHSEWFNHMLPTLPIKLLQPNDNLLIAFDARNKNPTFVMERITKQKHEVEAAIETPSRKNKRFFEEKSIPAHHRSRNQYYRNSGYDRGHLAPAADFTTDSEVQESFSLSNVSPQLPRFNRTMWLRVEEFVRKIANEEKGETSETWVMTGPLWLPTSSLSKGKFQYSYEAIGHPPSLIHVPTHFFKVIAVVSPNADTASDNIGSNYQLKKFAAFVIPQSYSEEEKGSRLRLIDCLVRFTDLEAVAGIEFFPNLLGSHRDDDNVPIYKELADALTDDVRAANKSKQGNAKVDSALLSQTDSTGPSKRRRKKINQLLQDVSPPTFQHLCEQNNACFKYL